MDSGACASRAHEKRCRPPFPLPLPESIAATPTANSSQDQHVGPQLQRIELVKFSVTALHRKCGRTLKSRTGIQNIRAPIGDLSAARNAPRRPHSGTRAGIKRRAACIRNRARRDRPGSGGRQGRASKSASSDCPDSGRCSECCSQAMLPVWPESARQRSSNAHSPNGFWNRSSFLPTLFSLQMSRRKESGHLAPPSPSAFGDLTGTSVPVRYLGQQSAVSSGSSGARRTTSHL